MPQLDPTYFAAMIVWLAIVFGALYLVLARVVLPRLSGVLEERQQRIGNDLAKAEALRREAEEVLAGLEQALESARADARAELAKAQREAAAEAAEQAAALQQETDRMIEEAQSRIDAARGEALDRIRDIAGEIATEAVAKVTGEGVEGAAVTQAVDETLSRRGGAA